MRRKSIAILLSAVMGVGMLSACGSEDAGDTQGQKEETESGDSAKEESQKEDPASEKSGSGATLEVEVGWTDEQLAAFEAVLEQYTEETGVKFEVVSVGEDLETQLKIRMASNDMPDLWITHGWSILRYKEYLTDLSQESWVGDINDAAKGVITDEDGSIYVMPASISLSNICFNKDVLKESGVDWTKLYTWDDFEAACEKIRDAGKTAVIMGAKDSGNAGGLLNSIGLGYYAPEDAPAHDQLAKFLDGSVDLAEAFDPIYDMITDWRGREFFNEDYMTLDTVGMQKMLGAAEGAFCSRTSTYIGAAQSYYPDANLGLMPYPAAEKGGKQTCAVGEGSCFGLWKDSEYKEEGKAFLEWLAKPENASQIIAFDGCTAGLNSTPDDSIVGKLYKEFVDAYGADNIFFDNMFDRKYLPNGMWNVLSEGAAQLLDGGDKADVASYMQENFESLYEEAHAD